MIASLPMYDWPELRQATGDWWGAIADRLGIDVNLLHGPEGIAAWQSPDLLFSQTCGYPLTHALAGRVALVATPHYAADGCFGPNYCSIVFARREAPLPAFRGSIAAVNNPDSMSGMLALKLVFAPHAVKGVFFSRAVETGGHINSMIAVRDGVADVCAIDAVCVALARRHRPEILAGLVEIARAPVVPGLPYVTVAGDVVKLRDALRGAFADPALAPTREHLLLGGFSVLAEHDYRRITELEAAMEREGGLELI